MSEASVRDQFYNRLKGAPPGAKEFFDSVAAHFGRRNDCAVEYTRTSGGDMRLWGRWQTPKGPERKQVFATLAWQPRNMVVFGRCKLDPAELAALGLEGAKKPRSAREPQNSEIRLNVGYCRLHVHDFIGVLEAARKKLIVT